MKKIVFILSLQFLAVSVFAWGQTGHRVIAQIAQNHLSKNAAKQIFEIMGHESLVEASTWMDNIKSDSAYDHTHSWHYVTIPNGENYASSEKNDQGDAYEAILRMKEIIKDENSLKEEKRDAIRMLTHLIGDIHQPLHVGNGKDRGGNSIKIKWFYESSNLHRIWDSEMINSKVFSYSELAKLIDHPYESTTVNYTSKELDLWVQEAMALRPQVYDFSGKDNLSYEYLYKNWDTVKVQLLKGGLRLAEELNELFQR